MKVKKDMRVMNLRPLYNPSTHPCAFLAFFYTSRLASPTVRDLQDVLRYSAVDI